MRIVHFSDMHGMFEELYPEADLYLCTGDALPNFPIPRNETYRSLCISRENEERCQTAWMSKSINQMRDRLGSPDAPIFCVRGNHDFVPIAPIFSGCSVTEIIENEVYHAAGISITGHRGVPYINGNWNDEIQRPDLLDRVRRMPMADIYITHYPPACILDDYLYGLEGMANELIMRHVDTQTIHAFGHVHEDGGLTLDGGSVLFSNAAQHVNILELKR